MRMEQVVITKKQAREQGLKHYFTGKPCKHGHVSKRYVSTGHCFCCIDAHDKQSRKNNPEKSRARSNKWKRANPERVAELREKSRQKFLASEDGRQHLSQIQSVANKKYRQTDKGRATAKRSYERRLADPQLMAITRIRTLVSAALTRAGCKKAAKTEDLLGCTVAEARAHLEAQFLPGMTWDNHGEWHIDHIRPCASFDFSDPAQQRECSHYTNLQPLWAKDNLSKSDKWEEAA